MKSSSNTLVLSLKFTDANCIRILAPANSTPQHPASFYPGEHIGHVSRETALVMSEFMDDHDDLIGESSKYGRGFIFVCRLREDTNHTVDGYAIDVVIFSSKSDSWANSFMNVFTVKNLHCTKLN